MQHSSVQLGVIIGFFCAIAAAYCHYVINREEDVNPSSKMSFRTRITKESIAAVHYVSDIVEVIAGLLLCYEVACGTNTNRWPIYLAGCILGIFFSLAPWNTSRNALGLGQSNSEQNADKTTDATALYIKTA